MKDFFNKYFSIRVLSWITMILTLAMIVIPIIFRSLTYLSHPQIAETAQYNTIKEIIRDGDGKFFYQLFFMVDVLWAAALLLLLYLAMKKVLTRGNGNQGKISGRRKTLFNIYIGVILLAYICDQFENFNQIFFCDSNHFAWIVRTKKILYACALGIPLLTYLWRRDKSYMEPVRLFFRSSYISIFILILIGGLMLTVPQSGTLLIGLMKQPFNFLGAFLMINFLALLLSHFPTYLAFSSDARLRFKYKFYIHHLIYGMGYVGYRPKESEFTQKTSDEEDSRLSDYERLRRMLGVLLLLIWMAALFYPVRSYFFHGIDILQILAVMSIFFAWWYHARAQAKKKIDQRLYASKYPYQRNQYNPTMRQIRSFLRIYWWVSGSMFVLLMLGLLLITFYGWNLYVNLFIIFVSSVNVVWFIEYRLSRSLFHFLYPHSYIKKDKLGGDNKSRKNQVPTSFVEDYYSRDQDKDTDNRFQLIIFKTLAHLSHNISFLRWMQVAGLITTLFFVFWNFHLFDYRRLMGHTNALNIILAYLIILYSGIVIVTKHRLFYMSKNILDDPSKEVQEKYKSFYLRKLPLAVGTAIVLLSALRPMVNKIHKLNPIAAHSDLVDLDEYMEDFKQNNQPGDTIYSIAADGGGMKANLWTMLVLDSLNKANPDLFCKTLSVSGVSGGAIGIGNYFSLRHNACTSKHQEIIKDIGSANVLTLDIVGFFVRDFVMSFLCMKNQNRSHYAMKRYAELTCMESKAFRNLGFREFWSAMYRKQNTPLLVINSTSTKYEQGMACSVPLDNEIPAIIDILDIRDDKTLSYYDALSTTNRFPFASPAARIDEKGYFVDGGYFENSGILASEHMYNYATKYHGLDTMNYHHVTINIINSKDNWTRTFVKNFEQAHDVQLLNQVNRTEELGAIFNTLVNIDKHPETLREEYELSDSKHIEYIKMPFPTYLQDIRKVIGNDIMISADLIDAMNANNDSIDVLLTSSKYNPRCHGRVPPPLSRYLSYEAIYYEQQMLKSSLAPWPVIK